MATSSGKTPSLNYMFVVLLLVFVPNVQAMNISYDDTRNVQEAVLRFYMNNDKPLRRLIPLEDQTQRINVLITFFIYSLDEFDPQTGTLKLTGSVSAEWMDETSSTSIGNYSFNGGEQGHTIFLPSGILWTPTIRLTNSVKMFKKNDKSYLLRYNVYDGRLLWQKKMKMAVTCKPDVKYFPIDSHVCQLVFAANDCVELESVQPDVNVLDYEPSASWKLLKLEIQDQNTGDENSIIISFNIQRKTLLTLLVVNVLLPVIVINILSDVVFLLPVKSANRIHFSMGCFLSFVFYLKIISKSLPQNGDPVSIITYFVLLMFVSIALVVITTILISHLSVKTSRVPSFVVKLSSFLDTITCKKHCRKDTHISDYNRPISDRETSQDIKPSENTLKMSEFTIIRPITRMTLASRMSVTTFASSTKDNVGVGDEFNDNSKWLEVSCAMDRFFFVFFVFYHCLVSLVFVLVIVINAE